MILKKHVINIQINNSNKERYSNNNVLLLAQVRFLSQVFSVAARRYSDVLYKAVGKILYGKISSPKDIFYFVEPKVHNIVR